jgi:hypothetical protein
MIAYSFIFQSKYIIICLLSIIIFLSLLNKGILFRAFLYNNTLFLSTLYYLLYITLVEFSFLIFVAFAIEFFFLLLYIYFFKLILKYISIYNVKENRIKLFIFIVLILNIIQLYINKDNYGIFSNESRIDYLNNNFFNKYITYTIHLLNIYIFILFASYLRKYNQLGAFFYIYVLINSIFSILAGSKGGAVINLISFFSLLDFKQQKRRIIILSILTVITLIFTIIFISTYLNLDAIKFIDLAFNRIFLVNDTRALSIDYYNINANNSINILVESFRSISDKILNINPSYPPIGQYLYQYFFQSNIYIGGNASATALFISYDTIMGKLIFFIILNMFVLSIFLLKIFLKDKILLYFFSTNLVVSLSQDFLAFQIIFIILSIYIIFKIFVILK